MTNLLSNDFTFKTENLKADDFSNMENPKYKKVKEQNKRAT